MTRDSRNSAVAHAALVIVLLRADSWAGRLALYVLNRATPVPASWGSPDGPRDDLVSLFNALQAALARPDS